MIRRPALLALAVLVPLLLAPSADAQFLRRKVDRNVLVVPPPADLPAADAAIWPFPAPPPQSWWDDKRPPLSRAADPLGGRRIGKGERLPVLANGIDAGAYRLWGLMPLQWQVLRGDEMIVEVWVRPARSVRQSIVRVIVRRDGEVFVQGRAGLACCEAGIARRLGFDAELPAGSAPAFQALRALPLWSTPRDVRAAEGGGAADVLCVDGTSYDITLVTTGGARSLRRACDNAEVGQAADVLEPVLRAALGQDARFDVLFPGGVDLTAARAAYAALLAGGGALKPDPDARSQAPGAEPAPLPDNSSGDQAATGS